MSFLLGMVLTHLNAPDQQTDKTPAFIEVLTLTDDQLISTLTYPFNSCENSKGSLSFSHTAFVFCLNFCSINNDSVKCHVLFILGCVYLIPGPFPVSLPRASRQSAVRPQACSRSVVRETVWEREAARSVKPPASTSCVSRGLQETSSTQSLGRTATIPPERNISHAGSYPSEEAGNGSKCNQTSCGNINICSKHYLMQPHPLQLADRPRGGAPSAGGEFFPAGFAKRRPQHRRSRTNQGSPKEGHNWDLHLHKHTKQRLIWRHRPLDRITEIQNTKSLQKTEEQKQAIELTVF